MTLKTINPATGETLDSHPVLSPDGAQKRLEKAALAAEKWRHTPIAERADCLQAAARILEERKARDARLMALEMGKPIRDGRAEIEKCAWVCRHYAAHGAAMLAVETVATEARKSYVTFPPLGVVLGIMPWNYPFWQVFRFAVPTLLAGNAVVLKHAANVPGCSLAIETIMEKAGLPPAVFQSLLIPGEGVQPVLAHPAVKAVALTGSNAAGQAVAAEAGRLMKPCVLELGGSDPYLILADADLALAATACAASRLLNSGQSCIAAKRFLATDPVRREFEQRLVAELEAVWPGDPLQADTKIGPLARSDLRDTLQAQVQKSLAQGARRLLGAEIPEGAGHYYPPTVLTDVQPGMPVFDEETFGPVAAVVPVADTESAVRLANASRFGLGAAVFSRDVGRAERIAAEKLEAGNCFVNTFVKSDPRLPFGGINQSGYGRELSHYGIKSFVNVKTVYVQ